MENYFIDYDNSFIKDEGINTIINFYDDCQNVICEFRFDTKFLNNGQKYKEQMLKQFVERLSGEHGADLLFTYGDEEMLKITKHSDMLTFSYQRDYYDCNLSVIIDKNLIETFKKLINSY